MKRYPMAASIPGVRWSWHRATAEDARGEDFCPFEAIAVANWS